jgi:RNA polymerase sigma-70 factor (ECF subfamily)
MSDDPLQVEPKDILAHSAFVRALTRSLIGDEHAAEDVAQETWLSALRTPPVLRTGLRSWLAGVVRKIAAQVDRGDARRRRREAASAIREEMPSAELSAERVEILERLVVAVKALEEPYRATILMRFFDDLSAAEIASRIHVPEATVRTRLRRALEQLRDRLDRSHAGDRRAWCQAVLPFACEPRASSGAGLTLASIMKRVLAMDLKLKIALLVTVTGAAVLIWHERGQSGPAHVPQGPVAAALVSPEPPPFAPKVLVAREPIAMDEEPDRDLDLFGVVSTDGGPIGDALVETLQYPLLRVNVWDSAVRAMSPGPSTRTATDGTFRIRLDRGQMVNLRVSAPGYATTELPGRYAGERVSTRLFAPVSLQVSVRDREGNGIPGVHLSFDRSS